MLAQVVELVQVEVIGTRRIDALVGVVPFGVDAGQGLELLVRLLMELHVRPQESGHVDVKVLMLILDNLINFINKLLCRAFQVQLHGASSLLLSLELSLLGRIRWVRVFEFLHLLELLLVVLGGLVTDRFPLLSILNLVPPHPERLVIRVQCLHVVLIHRVDPAMNVLNTRGLLMIKVLCWEYFSRRIAKPAVESGQIYQK